MYKSSHKITSTYTNTTITFSSYFNTNSYFDYNLSYLNTNTGNINGDMNFMKFKYLINSD